MIETGPFHLPELRVEPGLSYTHQRCWISLSNILVTWRTFPSSHLLCCLPLPPPLIHPYTSAQCPHTTCPGLASKLSWRWGIFYLGTIFHPFMDLQEIAISSQPGFSPRHVSWERDYGWAFHGDPSDWTGDLISLGLVAATVQGPGNGGAGSLRQSTGPGGRTTGLAFLHCCDLFFVSSSKSYNLLGPLCLYL